MTKDQIAQLLEQDDDAKTFAELMDEGIEHRGGLAQLAQAEQAALVRTTGPTLH